MFDAANFVLLYPVAGETTIPSHAVLLRMRPSAAVPERHKVDVGDDVQPKSCLLSTVAVMLEVVSL
jgi:hypothetical protein